MSSFVLKKRQFVTQIFIRPSWLHASTQTKRAIVVGADSTNVMEAVKLAKEEGFIEPILVGNKEKIEK